MQVISVMNYKGGVGKTTLTSNISAELAYRGNRVLMIDLDPQSSLTFSFVTPDDWKTSLSENRTIKNWFVEEEKDAPEFRSLIVAPQKANQILKENGRGTLHLLASHLDLINVDLELAAMIQGNSRKQQRKSFFKVYARLKKGIDSLGSKYDYIIVDCPPNFNIVTKNAIIASEHVLVPAKPDYLSTLGISYLERNLNELINEYNYFVDQPSDCNDINDKINPEILGVIFTMVQLYGESPISVQRQYIREVQRSGVPTFKSFMRENKTIFAEAPQYLVPVVMDKRGGRRDIVQEMENIVTELIDRINE